MTIAPGLPATPASEIRGLSVDDIDRIVAIDREHTGRTRRRFFEKRLEAAKGRPADFVHVGVMRGGALRGYAMARLLRGEFGREHATAMLDVIGVEAVSQELGVGQALIAGLRTMLRSRGVSSLQSQADWKNHAILQFLEASGFELAPRMILERSLSERLVEPADNA